MLSAMLARSCCESHPFPLLDLPQELVEKVVLSLGPEDQKAKRSARATCTKLRSAVNAGVSSVKVTSNMEGQSLPETLLPKLKRINVNVSNGNRLGLWSAENLSQLGIQASPEDCTVAVEVDSSILHLGELRDILDESGVLPRVRCLNHESWGMQGKSAQFGKDVEVRAISRYNMKHNANERACIYHHSTIQISAKLKLFRVECIDKLINNTLEHENLSSLEFDPMVQKAWHRSLIREINHSAANTLRTLSLQFRPYQEVDLAPLEEADLPLLEELRLTAQNENGFGPLQLQPLMSAKLPSLKKLVVELAGSNEIKHLGEFLRPLVCFPKLEAIEVWGNIRSFAGLWGVGCGGPFMRALRRLKLRVNCHNPQVPRAVFAANPTDRIIDAFTGLNLDKLELHDIGLPAGASASGIKQLVLTNPRWEDLQVAMSNKFSPDLKVIRVCGASARAMQAKMVENLMETPALEPGWRLGSPSSSSMHRVRSFVVLHDMEQAKHL